MKAKPLISDAQWRRISPHLAENRCDRAMIEAILYREFSGQSLSEVAEALDVTRVRLHQWHHAIEADGSLAKVMAALKLEPAGSLARRRTGRAFYHRDAAMVAAVAAIKLRDFRDALRGRR